jgi:Zn-dependent protease
VRGFKLASVWGIPIRIDVSLLVVLPVLAWLFGSGEQIGVYTGLINLFPGVTLDSASLRTGTRSWVVGVGSAVGLFASVALHELGHAWAARRYGIEVESITLWLLGGLASLASIPREWTRELVIALAGPAVSVLVGLACYGVVLVLPGAVPTAVFVFGWLAVTNLLLTVFNLLPAFPMDGGRVLRALLARSRPYPVATRTAARVGVAFAVLFAVVGALSFSPMLLLLAVFVYGAARGESRSVAMETLLDGLTAGDAATDGAESVDADTPLSDLATRMIRDRRTAYAVVDDSGATVGVVSLDRLRKRRRDAETVGDVAVTDVPRVAATDPLFDVVAAMSRTGAPAAFVVADGEAVGLITASDLATTLRIRRESGTTVAPRAAM